MHYPVIVHKDRGSDYGISVPDFPGVFIGGETLEEALNNVQEAIECFYEGENVESLPNPSPHDQILIFRKCKRWSCRIGRCQF